MNIQQAIKWSSTFAVCVLILTGSNVFAQQNGGGDGGGQAVDPGVVTPDDTTADGPTVGADDGEVDFDDAADLDFGGTDEDLRNRGFIGPTSTRLDLQGFVGASSVLGPDLATDAEGLSFGSNLNANATGGDNARSAVVPNVNASGFQAAQALGSTIIRRSIRARLRPTFFSPQVAPARIQNQFVSVVSRQPAARTVAGKFSITVQNKTAYLQGVVNNAREADFIVRQLRLQPGVYKIVNQLQVIEANRTLAPAG